METLWYALLGLLFAAYFVLAGVDYGVGLLFRHLARDDDGRRRALAAVGPFFLGNEVWLVAAIGALLGAFPLLDGKLLGTSSTLLAVLLCGLVVFTACVQIRSRAKRGREIFDVLIATGALVTVVGWGAFLGQLVQGLHGLPNWFSLLCGLVFAMLVLLHGGTFLALRGTDDARAKASAVVTAGVAPTLIGVGVVAVAGFFTAGAVELPVVAVAGVVILAAAVLFAGRWTAAGRRGRAFAATCVAVVAPLLIVGFARLPYGYVDAADPVNSLTVTQGATNAAAFDLLTIAAAPMIPVLLGFQAAMWWLWRRRVSSSTPLFY
ncbi:cytochrome d ubiquinol oxidase subunit II [Phytomonospora endophytica]|uniref:Cytochrome bd-type quinol oxidase subunit 2 n=1 Tax=Phytomonospora endophytica TaxID=714109 RepID=A0A841FCB8_9ACTN|nr:cytochrome d ubiquinol oxidase subunit II [Phytomonospora endophytica]MBB6033434.1 cytochrome bd-type quinol oxidase subunit 2 [Phytomonospora endophytica]GIG70793.1 cytochrome bd oxidase subunit II [Phytomonospora endophytica]